MRAYIRCLSTTAFACAGDVVGRCVRVHIPGVCSRLHVLDGIVHVCGRVVCRAGGSGCREHAQLIAVAIVADGRVAIVDHNTECLAASAVALFCRVDCERTSVLP